jgi:acyl-CoA thioesterase-1
MTQLGRGLSLVLAWGIIMTGIATSRADERLKDIACRSVHLSYPAPDGLALYNEVSVKNWNPGEAYRSLVTAKVNGKRSEDSGYCFVPRSKQWKRLVTFSTVTGSKPLSGYYSFVEDFKYDRDSARRVREASFGNGWVTTTSGTSVAVDTARFTADSNPVLNINAYLADDRFSLVTEGETENRGIKLGQTGSLPVKGTRKPPEELPLGGHPTTASPGQSQPAQPAAPALPVARQLPLLHLLHGPWEEGTIHRESILFIKGKEGGESAKLLYDAERVLLVQSPDGHRVYRPSRDYQLSPDGSGLELTPGSRLPLLDQGELFRPKGSPQSIGHRAGDPETSVLFDNGHFFHDHQVEVSYIPRRVSWNAYRPAFAGSRLPRTLDKLRSKQPLTIAVSGDSISEGYNASEYTKTPPYMPPYPTLVGAQLEQTYGSKVTLHNRAVAGWSSAQGVKALDELLKDKPDLVIVAYGMNDVGARNPEAFKANIETMLKRMREANPAIEVILVATMTGNPDWMTTPPEMFPKYRASLASLEGPGIAFADLTSVWLRVLERKRHTDLTGNGVNHPNDYGHRLYAQTILALLVDPALINRTAKPGR